MLRRQHHLAGWQRGAGEGVRRRNGCRAGNDDLRRCRGGLGCWIILGDFRHLLGVQHPASGGQSGLCWPTTAGHAHPHWAQRAARLCDRACRDPGPRGIGYLLLVSGLFKSRLHAVRSRPVRSKPLTSLHQPSAPSANRDAASCIPETHRAPRWRSFRLCLYR